MMSVRDSRPIFSIQNVFFLNCQPNKYHVWGCYFEGFLASKIHLKSELFQPLGFEKRPSVVTGIFSVTTTFTTSMFTRFAWGFSLKMTKIIVLSRLKKTTRLLLSASSFLMRNPNRNGQQREPL